MPRSTLAVALVLGATLGLAGRAAAAPAFTSCPAADSTVAQCTTVTVPLDRSGQVPGSIVLHVAKVAATDGAPDGTLVILTGGPGQSSLPLIDDFRSVFHDVLQHEDLVVFDQRGTGSSGVIDCPDLQSGRTADAASCAAQLGAARSYFTTRDSVADLESVREALGIGKIDLYGVSYGTKVARAYALTYPGVVSRLILDSTTPAAGPDPFMRSTFAALPRVLNDVCVVGMCRGVTSNPVADLAALMAKVAKKPLKGSVYDARGHRHRRSLTKSEVLDALLASDLDPGLRAELPAAIHSARHGDAASILRLFGLGTAQPDAVTDISQGLFAATTCEEGSFPWSRTSAAPERQADVNAVVAGLPATTYSPFDAATALGESTIPMCLSWPESPTPPTIPTGQLAGVPTLIFSGQEDLRTPLEDAAAVQQGITGSQLVQVADTGHSVLGTALSGCPGQQLLNFLGGTAVSQCLSHEGSLGVASIAPATLGAVGRARGVSGQRGKVVEAVGETLDDASNAFLAAVLDETVIRFGGLRGGWGRADRNSLALHSFTYVPGVKVTGSLHLSSRGISGTLRVKAPHGLSGTLHAGSHGVLSGTLGGRRVKDKPVSAASAARAGASAPAPARLLQALRLAGRSHRLALR